MHAQSTGSRGADTNVASNWWADFFEGLSTQLWLAAMPQEHTNAEAGTIARLLGASPGAELLDVPCGGGRLSLALAQGGYRLTGVDISREFLEHARSSDRDGSVRWEQREMRDLPWHERFDGAFCVGNSFGYLDAEGNAAFLRAVSAALKPGARFVLETPMVLENLLDHLQDRPWWKAGEIYLLVSNQYDHTRSRLDTEYTFLSNGRSEVRRGTHQAYKYSELCELIEGAGFDVATAEPWTRRAHSVTFVATRR
jgi:2-polyprenyl-3-methyl-5-hydroxy-6-metoxy-1,4-benzoquinol methylase